MPRSPLQAARAAGSALALSATSVLLIAPAGAQTPAAAEPAASAPATAEGSSPQRTATELPLVRVTGSGVDDAGTEGSGSYAAPRSTIGKEAIPLRETPQSVSVITRQQLDDQNLTTVEDALKTVTGVSIVRYDATGNYTQFTARGFAADLYQLDGLPLETDANGIYFDLAAYDRIEVQRGAGALYVGAGEPAVTVNLARKRALAAFGASGALSVGRWDAYRAEADVTGALNADGTLRGRLVAVAEDYDTYMDGIDGRKGMGYGTLELDLSPSTTVSVGGTWQDVRTVLSRGLPAWADGSLIDMPRSTMPVQDWNHQRLISRSAFAELEHRFANASSLKFSLRRTERGNDSRYLDPAIPAADGTMTGLNASAFERDNSDNNLDLYYTLPWQWRGLQQHWIVGADWRRSGSRTRYAGYEQIPGATLDLFDVDHAAIPEPDFDLERNVGSSRTTSSGVYTQLRFKPAERWTLVGGGRLSWWKLNSVSAFGGSVSGYEERGEFTPYGAVLFDLNRTMTVYGSINEIFKAQDATTASGEQIGPRRGRQLELGLKGEAADGRVTWLVSAYRLNDENRAITDPADDRFSIPAGKVRSQGFEGEVRGELLANWSVSAGYAYTDTRYIRAAVTQPTRTFSPTTPRHNANVALQHRITDGPAQGLDLGVAVRGVSDFYNGSGAGRVDGPAYTLVDVNVGYRLSPHLRLTLNVDNLLDRVYWEKVSYPGRQNFFGQPRNLTLALRANY